MWSKILLKCKYGSFYLPSSTDPDKKTDTRLSTVQKLEKNTQRSPTAS